MREGIYRKTDAGRDEIRDRGRRLSPPLRTVLLMVDGQRSLAQLREVAAGMKAPDDALAALLADGLIELVPSGFDAAGLMGALGPRPASRPPDVRLATAAEAAVAQASAAPADAPPAKGQADKRSGSYLHLYERMSEAVRAHLGLRGYFLQLKVERCGDADSLQALLPELRAAVAKAKGESFASDWERTLEVPA
ncbi:hypothetical protein MNQ95_02350 [Pseudoxanthomonas daejeonensis]|uniref:Proline-rich protein n=1 Tax=Pseudoxanthomonas daejeonensis TaxID=266062 RepID=A0ABQ6Z5H5_9GAMM|nr:hypothetical protein [Pseudoxanthomonas daejeonensis]KAF1693483.1 hypothetical protein CSC65_11810 [Pseudoxanthomonas daejeonensis]UNK57974.1 hypothetical protein MNQ95_02350 [Pseudoxanthomonas daejeonensis]